MARAPSLRGSAAHRPAPWVSVMGSRTAGGQRLSHATTSCTRTITRTITAQSSAANLGTHVTSGTATVNPALRGTKASWWYRLSVPAHGKAELRLRLHRPDPGRG